MKKIVYFSMIISLLAGFGCGVKEKAAITIDEITITEAEFNEAFQASRYGVMGEEGRKEFLKNYISKKLILKEAQKMALDKDPQFLNEIQFFWENALLKLILSKKASELGRNVAVSDEEIQGYYQTYQESHFVDKELPQAYQQIKTLLLKEKQSGAIAAWEDSLKQQANIKIEYRRLGIEE